MGSLPETFRKTISFLGKYNFDYLVIGGIASSTLGYPRMTGDIDICILLKRTKTEIKEFLQKANQVGFVFNEDEVIKRIKETGTFQISSSNFHIDFLTVSTDFEKDALARKQKITVYGIEASFPTPEDLILFKIVPARHIDIADVENIAKRFSGKLDEKYLIKWAQKLSDQAEDMRIYREVKRLLKL